MESLDAQYGFDDLLFLSETPEYLRCVVCFLVLRDPVQILTCGHKFCSLCFADMKKFAETNNKEFCCPIDRNVVDMAKIHEDVAMKRVIGNLRVQCVAYEDGCSWNGDLSDLEKHNKQCFYQLQKQMTKKRTIETDELICDIYDKVMRCESWMADKDKEMLNKDEEIMRLEHQLLELKEELITTKQQMRIDLDKREGWMVDKDREMAVKDKEIVSLKHELKQLKKEFLKTRQQKGAEFAASYEGMSLENEVLDDIAALKTLCDESVSLACGHKSTSELKKVVVGGAGMKTAPNIVIQHHRGGQETIEFSGKGNNYVSFSRFSTVSISSLHIGIGTKVWYEVQCWWLGCLPSVLQIGWASKNLTIVHHTVQKGVGQVSQSYSFDPISGSDEWKVWTQGYCEYLDGVAYKQKENEIYLGAALDMVNGTMSYSVNGGWEFYMPIEMDTVLFPAFSGTYVNMEVNFGDRPSKYRPPDDSYRTLVEMA